MDLGLQKVRLDQLYLLKLRMLKIRAAACEVLSHVLFSCVWMIVCIDFILV